MLSGQCNFQDLDTKYETSWKTEKVESPREESEQNPLKPKCARNLEVTRNNSNKLAGKGKYIYSEAKQIIYRDFLPIHPLIAFEHLSLYTYKSIQVS